MAASTLRKLPGVTAASASGLLALTVLVLLTIICAATAAASADICVAGGCWAGAGAGTGGGGGRHSRGGARARRGARARGGARAASVQSGAGNAVLGQGGVGVEEDTGVCSQERGMISICFSGTKQNTNASYGMKE